MQTKITIFLIMILLLCQFSSKVISAREIDGKIEIIVPTPGNGPVFKNISDMKIIEDQLLLVDNFGSKIFSFDLTSDAKVFKTIGRKGLGPGDLNLPTFIEINDNKIVVIDNIAFSIFDLKGKFLGKFRLFAPVISFTCLNSYIYCLEANPSKQHLISVYDYHGKKIQEFGEKFIKTKGYPANRFSPFFVERCLYDGKILTDNQYIYLVSKRFGKLFKYSPSGKVVAEADLSSFFGNSGEVILRKNKKIFVERELLNSKKKGIPRIHLFEDAVLLDDHLYLLSIPNRYSPKKDTLAITQINKKSFVKESSFEKVIDNDMRVFSFAVQQKNKKREFYLNFTNDEGPFIGKMAVKQ